MDTGRYSCIGCKKKAVLAYLVVAGVKGVRAGHLGLALLTVYVRKYVVFMLQYAASLQGVLCCTTEQ